MLPVFCEVVPQPFQFLFGAGKVARFRQHALEHAGSPGCQAASYEAGQQAGEDDDEQGQADGAGQRFKGNVDDRPVGDGEFRRQPENGLRNR